MTLQEKLEETGRACEDALLSDPISAAMKFLRDRCINQSAMACKLLVLARAQAVPAELLTLKSEFNDQSADCEPGALERALLINCALAALPTVPALQVDDSVKHLFCNEFVSYAKPPRGSLESFAFGRPSFVAMTKIVLLQRFPGGQQHWEIAGLPRSWFARIAAAKVPKTLWFTFKEMRGLRPYFVTHLGGTTTRLPLLTEREFLKSFCRVALAIERQPQIKGLMAGSWLHSLETHRVSPHLAFLNRPYMECGGHYVDARLDSEARGFLAGDQARVELYRSGLYKPTFGVVMCSRRQVIAWRRNHPEIVSMLAVR